MKKAPFIDDYGGNSYGGRRRTRAGSGSHQSFRCRDCQKIRYVHRRELARAAQPRCLACGGTLEETESEQKRHKQERKQVIERQFRCRICGVAMGPFCNDSTMRHLMSSGECRQELFRDGWTMACGAFFGTLTINRLETSHKRWEVRGVVLDGRDISIGRFHTQTAAKQFIRDSEDYFTHGRELGSIHESEGAA